MPVTCHAVYTMFSSPVLALSRLHRSVAGAPFVEFCLRPPRVRVHSKLQSIDSCTQVAMTGRLQDNHTDEAGLVSDGNLSIRTLCCELPHTAVTSNARSDSCSRSALCRAHGYNTTYRTKRQPHVSATVLSARCYCERASLLIAVLRLSYPSEQFEDVGLCDAVAVDVRHCWVVEQTLIEHSAQIVLGAVLRTVRSQPHYDTADSVTERARVRLDGSAGAGYESICLCVLAVLTSTFDQPIAGWTIARSEVQHCPQRADLSTDTQHTAQRSVVEDRSQVGPTN